MSEVIIRAIPNGPYLVEGSIQLHDSAGAKVPTEGRAKIALCRCGASSTKPFCDGSHSRIGFQAAEAANPQSAEKSK
jgi:CDGSH-type Zn-finger protein